MDREGDFVRAKTLRGRGRAWAWACVVMLNTVRAELVEAQVVHAALRQAQGERVGGTSCPSTGSGRTDGLRRLSFDEQQNWLASGTTVNIHDKPYAEFLVNDSSNPNSKTTS